MPSSLKARESLGQAGTHADTRSGHQNGKLHPTVNGRLAMNPAHRNTQIRCLCDVNIDRNHMIQCEVRPLAQPVPILSAWAEVVYKNEFIAVFPCLQSVQCHAYDW